MGQAYIGEIRMFAGNFEPVGWMFCQGQVLNIADYDALFNLIGTTYGGDGMNTFALPDLRGRVPLHSGNGYTLGQTGGAESVTLTTTQIPSHTHSIEVNSNPGNQTSPSGNFLAATTPVKAYESVSPPRPTQERLVTLSMQVGSSGSSQPHDNMIPFVSINFIISLFGVYPSAT